MQTQAFYSALVTSKINLSCPDKSPVALCSTRYLFTEQLVLRVSEIESFIFLSKLGFPFTSLFLSKSTLILGMSTWCSCESLLCACSLSILSSVLMFCFFSQFSLTLPQSGSYYCIPKLLQFLGRFIKSLFKNNSC